MNETPMARYQVCEFSPGLYAVKDTATGHLVSKTYVTIGWCTREAVKWQRIWGHKAPLMPPPIKREGSAN